MRPWLDVTIKTTEAVSAALVAGAAMYGLIFTVIPLYSKAVLEEQKSKLEIEVSELQKRATKIQRDLESLAKNKGILEVALFSYASTNRRFLIEQLTGRIFEELNDLKISYRDGEYYNYGTYSDYNAKNPGPLEKEISEAQLKLKTIYQAPPQQFVLDTSRWTGKAIVEQMMEHLPLGILLQPDRNQFEEEIRAFVSAHDGELNQDLHFIVLKNMRNDNKAIQEEGLRCIAAHIVFRDLMYKLRNQVISK